MSLSTVTSSSGLLADQYGLQGKVQPAGRYSLSLPNIASRVSRLILPTFALVALSSIPVAGAGPMAYLICVEACFLLLPFIAPACILGCLPLLTAPTP